MSTLSVDVHFGRDLGVLESEEVDGGVFDMHGVVLRLDDERGRCFASDHNIGVGCEVLVCEGEVARIDDHGEVRAATELISGIDRIVETLIEVSAEGGGKVGSSREAEDADPVRVDSPVGGMGADDTESPLGILEGSRRLGIGPGIGHAVFEQGACDAGGVEPVAYLGAFEVDGQDPVSTSGKDDNGGAGVLGPGGVESEGWRGDVAQTDERLAGDEVVLGSRGVDLRARIGLGAGGAPCGHTGRVMWPGAGCQAGFWANRLLQMPTAARRSRRLRMDFRASGFNFLAIIADEGAVMQVERSALECGPPCGTALRVELARWDAGSKLPAKESGRKLLHSKADLCGNSRFLR